MALRMPFPWALDADAFSDSSFAAPPSPRFISGGSQVHRLSHSPLNSWKPNGLQEGSTSRGCTNITSSADPRPARMAGAGPDVCLSARFLPPPPPHGLNQCPHHQLRRAPSVTPASA